MRLRFTQESDFRLQRDFGQKFSATFEFIGEHWQGLGRALLYIVLPASLLRGILGGLVQKQLFGFRSGSAAWSSALAQLSDFTATPMYWVSLIINVVFFMLLVLTVYGYMVRCLQPTPLTEPVSVREVWVEVRKNFFGAFFSYFGLVILMAIGFLFLFVPGMYLAVAFSMFYIVKVVENTGFGATGNRCIQLVQGKWWSTFGLLFIMMAMLWLLFAIFGGLAGSIFFGLGQGLGLFKLGESTMGVFSVITSTLGGLFGLLIYPPILISIAFQYFNLVERRDAVGLRKMVDMLGRPPVAVQNAAYRPDEEGEY